MGDLGAGKTVFAQGFAAALGVPGPVTSPTFALVRQYRCGEGSPVGLLIHADVYRTGSLDEVADLALAELVEEDAVALVEWGELAAPALGDSALEITLVAPDPEGAPERRVLTLVGRGRWADAGRRGGCAAGVGHPRGLVSGGDETPVSPVGGAMVAIETATETVGVAVRTATGVQAELTLTGRRRHVETLTPALEHLLQQLNLVPGDLGVVAVDIGPGLFTGLRVGLAAAKGLAQSLGLGVMGATSLDILTAGAAAAGLRGLVLSCVDARRGEVFAAVHEVDVAGPRAALHEVRLGVGLFSPEDLATALGEFAGEPVHAVGDGALRYADVLRQIPGVDPEAPGLAFPPPAALLELVSARITAGEPTVEPAAVVPLYLREADAVSNFARAVRA